MKITNSLFVVLALSVLLPLRSSGQGTFQNLNFEQAVILPVPDDPYNRVQFSAALAGWTGYVGASIQSLALYNSIFLDSTGLGIHDANSFMTPIAGNYSLFIQSKYELSSGLNLIGASIAQTGIVPANVRSLQFKASAGNFQVSLGGQPLSLVPLLTMPAYTMYGADVTPFAATLSELRFTVNPVGAMFLDSISLSTEVVPEPAALMLLFFGGMVWMGWRKIAARSRT